MNPVLVVLSILSTRYSLDYVAKYGYVCVRLAKEISPHYSRNSHNEPSILHLLFLNEIALSLSLKALIAC